MRSLQQVAFDLGWIKGTVEMLTADVLMITLVEKGIDNRMMLDILRVADGYNVTLISWTLKIARN